MGWRTPEDLSSPRKGKGGGAAIGGAGFDDSRNSVLPTLARSASRRLVSFVTSQIRSAAEGIEQKVAKRLEVEWVGGCRTGHKNFWDEINPSLPAFAVSPVSVHQSPLRSLLCLCARIRNWTGCALE